jgi:hypothetical protein
VVPRQARADHRPGRRRLRRGGGDHGAGGDQADRHAGGRRLQDLLDPRRDLLHLCNRRRAVLPQPAGRLPAGSRPRPRRASAPAATTPSGSRCGPGNGSCSGPSSSSTSRPASC